MRHVIITLLTVLAILLPACGGQPRGDAEPQNAVGSLTGSITFEAETLARTSNVSTQVESDPAFSNGQSVKVLASAVNDYVEFTLPSVAAGTYGVAAYYKSWNNRSTVQGAIDGTSQGASIDMFAPNPAYQVVGDTGTQTWSAAGNKTLRLTVVGKNASSSGYLMHIDKIVLQNTGGTPNNPPTVATAAAASPNPVTGTTTSLSVLGADDGGEANLTYAWTATATPTGSSVTFGANGSNTAKHAVATFPTAGSYTLQAKITDQGGLTATSAVSVVVKQVATSIAVAPSTATVIVNGTQQFSATGKDQFGAALAPQPTFAWTVNGGGAVNATTGLFTAGGSAGGPYTVTASAAALTGSATVTIGGCAPTNCAAQHAECGTIPDGCGHTLTCPVACGAPATCGGGGTANVCGFTTHFNSGAEATMLEKPISQGGIWLNGQTDGTKWSDVWAGLGRAYGAPTNTKFSCGNDPGRYADPSAILSGGWQPDGQGHSFWNPNQTVTATAFCGSNVGSVPYPEVELRLHFQLSNGLAQGYEITWRCSTAGNLGGSYVGVARWNGALCDYTSLPFTAGPSVINGGQGVLDGDTVTAQIVGSTITLYKNGQKQAVVSDPSPPNASFGFGNPGLGFNYIANDTGGATSGLNDQFGFTSFVARDLP